MMMMSKQFLSFMNNEEPFLVAQLFNKIWMPNVDLQALPLRTRAVLAICQRECFILGQLPANEEIIQWPLDANEYPDPIFTDFQIADNHLVKFSSYFDYLLNAFTEHNSVYDNNPYAVFTNDGIFQFSFEDGDDAKLSEWSHDVKHIFRGVPWQPNTNGFTLNDHNGYIKERNNFQQLSHYDIHGWHKPHLN